MSGFRSPYVPGWDTHGLPIEQQLTKMGYDRKKMNTSDFRDLCRKYALEQVDKQRNDFKRLGVAGEWDNPYITLTKEYEAAQIRVFGDFAKKGLLYRGKKPVFWSWSSESALAEAEVDYKDVTSPSAFYGERVIDGKGVLDTDTYMVVWTRRLGQFLHQRELQLMHHSIIQLLLIVLTTRSMCLPLSWWINVLKCLAGKMLRLLRQLKVRNWTTS